MPSNQELGKECRVAIMRPTKALRGMVNHLSFFTRHNPALGIMLVFVPIGEAFKILF